MKYTCLGRAGAKVSKICLGTMNFGNRTDEKESFAIMDRALECGINFFDTANFYGNPPGKGITESVIGRWIAQGNGRRRQIVLASKVYATMDMGVNDRGLCARHLRLECEDALKRLQTDWIDLWQMHHMDRGVRSIPELGNIGLTKEFDLVPGKRGGYNPYWDEIWHAMDQLYASGKITYVGSANFPGWQITLSQMTAWNAHLPGLATEQSIYHLMNRSIEREVVPACNAMGMGILCYSPLGGGILGGVVAAGKKERLQYLPEDIINRLTQYEDFCKECGIAPSHMALAWLLAQESVTSVIIGPRTLEQLEDSIKAIDVQLTPDMMAKLNAIWPGPGEAPEAYSW